MPPALLDFLCPWLQYFEGFQALPYTCPGGHITIGYGHIVTSRERFPHSLSLEEARLLLVRDIQKAYESLLPLVSADLSPHELAALTSFIFNVGPFAFMRSRLRRRVNRGDKKGAAAEFQKWIWAKNVKLPGLMRRRTFERKLYEGLMRP